MLLLRRMKQGQHLQGLHPSHVGRRRFYGGPQRGEGERRQAQVLGPVIEERGQRATQRRGSIVDGEDGVG